MSVQILHNVLKFLERVEAKGSEAYAWCEAHAYVKSEIDKLASAHVGEQVSKGVEAALKSLQGTTDDTQ